MILCAKRLDLPTVSPAVSAAIPRDASVAAGGPVFPSRRRLSPLARRLLEASSEKAVPSAMRPPQEAVSVA